MFYLEKSHWNKFPVRLMRVVVYYDISNLNRDSCIILSTFLSGNWALAEKRFAKTIVCLVMPKSGPQYNFVNTVHISFQRQSFIWTTCLDEK